MKNDEYMELQSKLSEIMSVLEDLESNFIAKLGDRCHTAVWVRLTSCYVVLTSLQFRQEYKERFGDEPDGWSMTE